MLISHYVHDVEFIDCVFGAQSLNRKSKISPSTKNNIEKIAGIFQENTGDCISPRLDCKQNISLEGIKTETGF